MGKLGAEEYRSGKIWDWRNVGSGEGEIYRGNSGWKYCRSLKRMFQLCAAKAINLYKRLPAPYNFFYRIY